MFTVLENFYSNHASCNSAVKPMNLGNNPHHTSYTADSYKKVDVVFQPVRNIDDSEYVALVEDETDIMRHIKNDHKIDYPVGIEDGSNKDYDMFSVGDDSINNFFIGSITVVGLFILFSFLQKHNK